MSEKRFKLQHINDLTDQEYMRLKKVTDNGKLITLEEVVDLLNEQQATITNLQGEIERQKYIIEELRKDNYNKFELINKMKKEEKLYAKEILRLNELNKQINNFNRLCGGY